MSKRLSVTIQQLDPVGAAIKGLARVTGNVGDGTGNHCVGPELVCLVGWFGHVNEDALTEEFAERRLRFDFVAGGNTSGLRCPGDFRDGGIALQCVDDTFLFGDLGGISQIQYCHDAAGAERDPACRPRAGNQHWLRQLILGEERIGALDLSPAEALSKLLFAAQGPGEGIVARGVEMAVDGICNIDFGRIEVSAVQRCSFTSGVMAMPSRMRMATIQSAAQARS